MGIASMVIGIVSAILGFVPLCNYFALIPASIGFILGIVDVAIKSQKKVEGKGIGIAGIVLNAIAIALIVIWSVLFVAATAATSTI